MNRILLSCGAQDVPRSPILASINDVRSSWHASPGTADIPGNRITYQFMTTDRRGVPYICYREALINKPAYAELLSAGTIDIGMGIRF